MSDPIVFISRNRVKEGSFEDFRQHYRDSLPLTEANKPGTVAQLAYFDEQTNELVIVRLFPDAEALDQQLQGAESRSKIPYQFIEPTAIEIYGKPNDYALEIMKKVAGAGIKVGVYPQSVGGFIRPRADAIRL